MGVRWSVKPGVPHAIDVLHVTMSKVKIECVCGFKVSGINEEYEGLLGKMTEHIEKGNG